MTVTETVPVTRPVPQERSPLRAVAMPAEHGGWGLTAEPALAGLLVARSTAGLALGLAAIVAFMLRTPLKLALIDRWRGRRLDRTRLAERVAAGELVVLLALGWWAITHAARPFWWPLAVAAPLVAVELWFDVRSRSRRLVPELAGAVGISAVSAAIVLAGGKSAALGAGVWLILAARAVGSITAVRVLIARLHKRPASPARSDATQLLAALAAIAAVVLDHRLVAGLVAVVAVTGYQLVVVRRPVPPVKRIGIEQSMIGAAVVAITAVGVLIG